MSAPSPPRRKPIIAIWMICPLVLAALYLASFGPVSWLFWHGGLSEPSAELLSRTVYYPIRWTDENTTFFQENVVGRAYGRYIDWWAD